MNEGYYYFTFGVEHPVHAKHYVKLWGTYEDTRNKMFEAFGDKWAGQYDEKDWQASREKYFYDYTEIEWKE